MVSAADGLKLLLLIVTACVLGAPGAALPACPALLDHRFNSLQGKSVDLCEYANRPILAANPFFRQLRAATGKAPQWNFHKYLIAPDGKTVYSFPAQVEPDSAEILGRLAPMLK